jgi:hypothetical protein
MIFGIEEAAPISTTAVIVILVFLIFLCYMLSIAL